MSIGDKIRHRRKELGLTQSELGQRVHKSSQVISNWERGYTTGIAPDDLLSLASALNTDIHFFIPAGQSAASFMIADSMTAVYEQPALSDKRLKSLIDAYPHLDEKSKQIIEAIVNLSNVNDKKA